MKYYYSILYILYAQIVYERRDDVRSDFTVAVHCLALLAIVEDHKATSEHIAYNVATNPTRIRKIMSQLRQHSFVHTKEGIGGGYLLQCNPEVVTLADIYEAMTEVEIKPHWSSGNKDAACIVAANLQCVMDEVFIEAEQHYKQYLKSVTLLTIISKLYTDREEDE